MTTTPNRGESVAGTNAGSFKAKTQSAPGASATLGQSGADEVDPRVARYTADMEARRRLVAERAAFDATLAPGPGGIVKNLRRIYGTPEGKRIRKVRQALAKEDLANMRTVRKSGLPMLPPGKSNPTRDEITAYHFDIATKIKRGVTDEKGVPQVPMQATGGDPAWTP